MLGETNFTLSPFNTPFALPFDTAVTNSSHAHLFEPSRMQSTFHGELGPADVVVQFNNIQMNFSNESMANPLNIPSLRAYCQREDISIFAKSLAEYIAEMEHTASSFCDATTRILLIVFLCVGLFGFIGNLLTVLVIFRTPSLHSQTNYFLVGLAISDLFLIIVGVPFDIFFLWKRKSIVPPFNGFCEATSTSISWFTFNSILMIVGLTGERLVAICYPFSLRPYFHRNAVIWFIIFLWVISFFPSLYIGLQFKIVIQDFCGRTHEHPNGVGSKCDFVGWGGKQSFTFEVMLFLSFVLPVIFIVYCYVKILRTLNEATCNSHNLNATLGNGRNSNSQPCSQNQVLLANALNEPSPSPDDKRERFFNTSIRLSSRSRTSYYGQFARESLVRSSHLSRRSQKAHKTVLLMLIMIATIFFMCYLPYHLERLIVKYHDCAEPQACLWLYHGTGVLQYISAAFNPIIYNIMSRRFRREFQRIFYSIVKKEMKPEVRMRHRCHTVPNQHLQMTALNRIL